MPVRPASPAELAAWAAAHPGHLPWDPARPTDVLLVDLDAAGPDGLRPLDGGLGAVVVGTTTGEVDPALAGPAAAGCDLLLAATDDAGLAAVVATVAAAPLAAVALAGLLRGAPHRSVDAGLLAESAVYSALQAGPEFAAWRRGRPVRTRPADGPAVTLERDGHRLTLTLCRPAARNALDRAVRDGLLDGLALAEADPTITEVHLRGEGPAFCAGGDLDEFGQAPDPATAHVVRLAASLGRALHRLAPRVTAHLHGACAGSGIELPAFAGRVQAAPDTRITLPEVALGLVPGAGGTVSLPRRIGRHRTAELALAGRVLDGPTALAWGLVDELAP